MFLCAAIFPTEAEGDWDTERKAEEHRLGAETDLEAKKEVKEDLANLISRGWTPLQVGRLRERERERTEGRGKTERRGRTERSGGERENLRIFNCSPKLLLFIFFLK